MLYHNKNRTPPDEDIPPPVDKNEKLYFNSIFGYLEGGTSIMNVINRNHVFSKTLFKNISVEPPKEKPKHEDFDYLHKIYEKFPNVLDL